MARIGGERDVHAAGVGDHAQHAARRGALDPDAERRMRTGLVPDDALVDAVAAAVGLEEQPRAVQRGRQRRHEGVICAQAFEHAFERRLPDEHPGRRLADALDGIGRDPMRVAAAGRTDLEAETQETVVPVERKVVVVAGRQRVLVDPRTDVPYFNRIGHHGVTVPRQPAQVAGMVDLEHAAGDTQAVGERGLALGRLIRHQLIALNRGAGDGAGIAEARTRAEHLDVARLGVLVGRDRDEIRMGVPPRQHLRIVLVDDVVVVADRDEAEPAVERLLQALGRREAHRVGVGAPAARRPVGGRWVPGFGRRDASVVPIDRVHVQVARHPQALGRLWTRRVEVRGRHHPQGNGHGGGELPAHHHTCGITPDMVEPGRLAFASNVG